MRRNYNAGQKPVFLAMQKHPGVVYSAESLADEMGLHTTEDVRSVARAFTSLAHKGHIERVAQGRYLFRKLPEPKPTKAITVTGNLYEGIGIRKSTGLVIVKDDDNNLYELHEL